MYDHIKCELTLPLLGADSHKIAFQTKSLGCQLYTYIIGTGGRLFVEESDKSLTASSFTGTFEFYTITKEWDWLEYEAEFKKGSICSLRLIKSQASSTPSSTESEWITL